MIVILNQTVFIEKCDLFFFFFHERTRFVPMPCAHCAISSHPLPPVTASGFMCMWLPRRPSTVPSLQGLSHRLMYSPSTPSPSPSFMMETDTNTVIGFRDKLFTLPVLSAAVSLLRGHPFYKWPLFLDLILLIDPRQRQYMCDWASGGALGKSSASFCVTLRRGWCVLSAAGGLCCGALGALRFTAW